MIKNNVSVTFTKNNGKQITVEGDIVDGKLYRAGTVVRCDCNRSEPFAYEYDSMSDIFKCPNCESESQVIDYNHENDVQLYYIGVDYNTMQELYKLSDTLPYNTWLKVSEYFVKLSPVDVELDYPLNYVGWVTSVPSVVEELLDVPVENRVCNRDVLKELEERVTSDNVNDSDVYFDYVDKLHEVFSVVETPYGAFALKGEVIPNPLYKPNDYGRGEYWVVEEDTEDIWDVHLNYQEGDNLHMNNIIVDGRMGGIGKRIDFDENVYDLLLKLKQ